MDNNYSFYATLTVNFLIDDIDFNFICEACKSHYDFKVRQSNEIGGFLNGFRTRRTQCNGMDITNEDRILQLNASQLGLIMKSFEMQSSEQASRLNLMFHKITFEMATKQKTINKNISGWTSELK